MFTLPPLLANFDAVQMFNMSAVAMLAKFPAKLASRDGFTTASRDDPPLPLLTNGEPGVVGVGGCVFDPPNGE